MFYVYLLYSQSTDKMYIGYSADLRRRLSEHNAGQSQYTSRGAPWELVYYEAFCSETDARVREQGLKNHAQGIGHLKNRLYHSLHKRK